MSHGGEKIVISGISGVFPESDNVEEFKENLFAKKDLTTLDNRRWNIDKFKGPSKIGKIKTLSKFDHSFFRVHRKHANGATPASRILFEKTYEAIVDAGYNPEHLKGSKTGVYIGIGFNDWEDSAAIAGLEVNESFVTGKSRSVIANRISYWLDINGPSYAIDTACSSSLYALECAYSDIQDGKCDAAIVGAFNLCLLSYMNEAYTNMGILSKNNLSRPFDAEADGFVRSEAVAVVFLQKEKDARRRYANVINIKTSCDGYKEEGLAYPSGKSHKQLYKGLYQDINLDPQKVSYIEAHGTATTIGDIVEINALEEFFCANRQDPLKIGSVKSNMGHSEACAGLCSLIKMIISFESGLIPPNINLQTLNPKINGFHNGKVEVITDVTRCEGEFFGINSFGVGGANAHLLVSPNPAMKKNNSQPNEIPCLVTLSGRTEEAVNVLAQDVKKNFTDPEYIRLLHEIFKDNINGHLYRGYSIVHKDHAPTKFIKNFSQEERPIWYILTGMGSQWSQMGKNLMKIPEFAQSIHRSNRLLETVGVNLIEILTDKNPQIFDDVLSSFIGITAIQVALIDILQMLQIKPNGIIGHSVGELGCAYADGCLTAEQTVLCAYYRGLVLANNKSYRGTIAAVAQKYEDLIQSLPNEIDLACYNGAQTYAISGPSEIVENYVKDVQQKGIFAREINSSHIAFHSRYIAPAGPDLLYHLKKVISYPQLRSKKWICTSAPEDQWNTNKAKYSSAEYFVNNLISPVYFEQALCHIPNNAIVIEIAPHGLLQALLKRSLPPTVDNIPLISKNEEDTVFYLLNSIGKLYTAGLAPNLSTLYPPIHFPVSRGTPMISPLIRWLHDEEWFVPQEQEQNIKSGERTVIINGKKDFEYLRGHIIDDRNLFPAAGYIILIWETIAMMNDKPYTQLPVVFDQVRFLRATTIPEEGVIRLHISVQPGTGTFEITESRAVVVSGRVYIPDDPSKEIIKLSNFVSETQALTMSTKDIYKALRLRGYHYQGIFKAVTGSIIDNTLSKVSWTNNFIAFLDTMTHPILLTQDTNELMIPTFDRKIVIDPKKHFDILETLDKEKPEFSIRIDQKQKIIRAGGIDIYGMKFVEIARRRDMSELVLEKYQFVPNFSKIETDINTSITMCTHIVLENLQTTKVKSIEFLQRQDDVEGCLLSPIVSRVLNNLPLIQANISIISDDESHLEELNHDEINIENKKLPSDKSCTMIIVTNILNKLNTIPNLLNALKDNGFIIAREQIIQDQSFQNSGLDICFARIVGKEKILLLRKASPITKNPIIIKLDNFSYPWISQLKESIGKLDSENGRKLIIYAEKEPLSGIIGFFNCIRKEPKGDRIRCFFLMDKSAPKFSLDNPLYRTQFDKNLSHNIYKNGEWGSYRHLLLEPSNNYESLHAYANVAARGDLSTLKWFEGPIDPFKDISDEKPLIHVYYSALNFRDIVLATGKLSLSDVCKSRFEEECIMGVEYSGRDENGIRYMGICWPRSISTLVLSDPLMLWKIPDHMTIEEASTIPTTYATAILALLIHGNLQKGQSVLIHAGTGGVGLACINICMYYNCIIFATVSTKKKINYLRQTFPQILASHIGNSRDTSFEEMIMEQTNGRGVDIVLNSLADDKFHASLRCVAKNGKFLEIGKYDMSKNTLIDSNNFLKAVSFHSVMLDNFWNSSLEVRRQFHQKMQNMIDEKIIKSLRRTVFAPEELETAFRYMAAGKHIGKVVIKIRDEEKDLKSKPIPMYMAVQPRIICRKDQTYIIIGGLGGFGLELAEWLIIRGARNIVLCSRQGIKNGYQSFKLALWKSYGTNVIVNVDDVTTENGIKNLLHSANTLAPVIGIFNVAVILQDYPFNEQTAERFAISVGPKATATLHLDRLSRTICPHLKHFVIFSSVSCGRGNAEQTNYGMANSIMERICEARRLDNLPALAIQWGAIGEVGVVADFAEDNRTIVIGGTLQQKLKSCLQALNSFMKQQNTIVSSMIVAEKHHSDSNIVNTAANILGIKDLKSISLNWTLPELGMDSMMTAEFKQVLESEFQVSLTQQDIKSLTFGKLYSMMENEKRKQSLKDEKVTIIRQESFNKDILHLPIIRIPSLADNGSIKEVNSYSTQTIFVFPGIEGIAKTMEPLGKNIYAQLLCLQYHFATPQISFQNLAKKLLPLIADRLPPNQPFYFISFGIGTKIAIEIAKILGEQGHTGNLWIIKGSLDFLEDSFSTRVTNTPLQENEMQITVLTKCLNLFVPGVMYNEFLNDVREQKQWQSRRNFITMLMSDYTQNEAAIRDLLDYVHWVAKATCTYVFSDQISKIAINLIRTNDESTLGEPEDYGFSKYFKTPVRVHRVETDHKSILSHETTAQIINKGLVSSQ